MNTKKNNEPPHSVMAFFRWFCHPGFREEIEGDLLERFQKRSEQYGTLRNWFLFMRDVLTLFRPGLMGNFNHLTFKTFSMMERFLLKFSDYYLILLILLVGYKPPFSVSSPSLWIAAVLILQIIIKNRVSGAILAGLFIALNWYMILAMISEFSEFPTFSRSAQLMLFGASLIFMINIMAGGAMIAKYVKDSIRLIFRGLFFMTGGIYSLALLLWSNRFPTHDTSDVLFYGGLVLFVFILVVGIIVIYRWYKKDMAESELQAEHLKL